jgi:hypothetical protein
MRSDMAKVIVERPRYGSFLPSRKKGYRKQLQRTAIEDQLQREPMPGRWRGRERSLNEHLGPMRRFLRSNIGRPWNKVHQELCEHVSFANAVQSHILDHIDDYVERYVELVNGVPVATSGWRIGRRLQPGCLYVCPKTGILRAVRERISARYPNRLQLTHDLIHVYDQAIWWELRVRLVPVSADDLWDVWLERRVATLTKDDCVKAYGGHLFATSKRALSREEVQKLLKTRREQSRRRTKSRGILRLETWRCR